MASAFLAAALIAGCEPGAAVGAAGLALVTPPAQPADSAPVLGPAAANQTFPAVAFDGSEFVAVWEDARVGTLYGTRLSTAGVPLDSVSFPIAGAVGARPALAWSGAHFLLVWQGSGATGAVIQALRFAPDGTVLDAAPLVLATAPSYAPAVAFAGGQFLVTWYRGASGSFDIYGTRVGTDGTVLDPAGIAISTATADQTSPDVGTDGTGFFVVWQDSRAGGSVAYGTLVNASGTVLSPAGIPLGGSFIQSPAVASNGSEYLVVWNQITDVHGTRVSTSGTVLDPGGVTINNATGTQYVPQIVFDGSAYWAVWQDTRGGGLGEIYGSRITGGGALTVQSPAGVRLVTPLNARYPALAAGGGGLMTLWYDQANASHTDILGSAVSLAGVAADPAGRILSTSANAQQEPQTCTAGTFRWLAWTDTRHVDGTNLYARRVDARGIALDPAPTRVSVASNAIVSGSVLACAEDGGALVLWESTPVVGGTTADVLGAFLGPNGAAGVPFVIAVTDASGGARHAVASNGVDFLVTYEVTSGGSELRAARIARDGTVLDPTGVLVASAPSVIFGGTVVWDGVQWLAAWSHDGGGGNRSIRGTRITPAGAVVVPGGTDLSPTTGFRLSPRLAAGRGEVLVMWSETFQLAGAVLHADGTTTVAPAFAEAGPGTNIRGDALGFDGNDYWLTWTSSAGTLTTPDRTLAVRIDAEGNTVDASPFVLVDGASSTLGPVTSGDSNGNALIAYERFDTTPEIQSWRVETRAFLVDPPPDPGSGSGGPLALRANYTVGCQASVVPELAPWLVVVALPLVMRRRGRLR